MRFTVAWADIAKKNVTLKTVILCMSLVMLGLIYIAKGLASKKAIIIERGCYSNSIEAGSQKHTQDEIKSFVKLAIEQRLNSQTNVINEYLSKKELKSKEVEQKELLQKQMKQSVLVNDIKLSKNGIFVDSDRIISVGKIRSAFRFPLQVWIESVPRSQGNPYGLILTKVSSINIEREKESAN